MTVAFFVMAAIIVASALGVVASRNPIHSALCLVVNLLTVAGLFALLDAHFLAAAQIIVYAGAIVVLVLFVLMLLNLKVEQVKTIGVPTLIATVLTGIAFVFLAVPLLNRAFKVFPDPSESIVGSVSNIGKLLYTRYLFPFEAASILILAAIVGAVMLARRRSRASKGGQA